ncbi:MAG: hypothetical protein AUK48_09325 [Oscillatoriales cyanobacterium CG2_30_44_21]|nr:MAG: hypothetical protein AUK48_09325 [Oscillatoriales cyanobacterium CG2_30_44_21]
MALPLSNSKIPTGFGFLENFAYYPLCTNLWERLLLSAAVLIIKVDFLKASSLLAALAFKKSTLLVLIPTVSEPTKLIS